MDFITYNKFLGNKMSHIKTCSYFLMHHPNLKALLCSRILTVALRRVFIATDALGQILNMAIESSVSQ